MVDAETMFIPSYTLTSASFVLLVALRLIRALIQVSCIFSSSVPFVPALSPLEWRSATSECLN